jgi:DHA2 family multidrug resistance protein-like MFS transporter
MDIPADGVPAPQRYWAVLTIALAVGLAVVDGAIANIALPTIAIDMNATPSAAIWVINAYQLAVTITLLPLAALGEIYGYRRIYMGGLAIFTIASLCCAVSGSLVELTLARVLQGLGAAGIMSVNSALTRFVYPRSQLGRGMGINALVAATCAALGPTLASGILSIADWTWLFAINVPLGLIAFVIALRSLPATPRALHRFDALSALLSGLTFGLLIIGIDSYAHGGGAVGAVVELGASAVCGAVLVRRQLDRSAPLLPVDLLAIPLFRLSAATSVLSFAAQALAVVSLPFILEGAMAWNATETGLLMTPWPVATAIMAPLAGRLADRHSAGILGGIGMAAFATGLVLLAVLPADAGAANIGWRMAVCGMGFGFFQSPNNRAMITSAPLSRSGGASGMLGTARLLGQTVGAALVALIFGLSGHTTVAALVVAAAFAACGGIASLLRLSPARTPPAR